MQGRQRFSPRKLARRFSPGFLLGNGTVPQHRVHRFAGGRRFPGGRRFADAHRTIGTLGRIGDLEVRLARNRFEIRRAQALRYHVFYEEMAAVADARTLQKRRDIDSFDRICDHLLVFDHGSRRRTLTGQKPKIVGTYRLLRQDVAALNGGFYTADEYDIAPLLARHRDLSFLELGRSCVLEPYRNKRTVELLWHGNWSYILMHRIDAMFGCASLEGTDPEKMAMALSYLHHFHRAPDEWNVRALDARYVDMNLMAAEDINKKVAMRSLPPLIKGYLRLGAYVGDGAVIDHQFGTTDVLIILPVAAINPRYVNYYGADASRHAAPRGRRNLT
ncbi:MAG: GNAT family N-acetyltransferase [Alphaproteobacteria bacterium]